MGQIRSIHSVRLSGDGRPVRLADDPFLDSIVARINDEQRVAQRIEEDTLREIQKITSNATETGLTGDRRSTGIPMEGRWDERRRVSVVRGDQRRRLTVDGRHLRHISGENGEERRRIC